jgi:hypothetical protein
MSEAVNTCAECGRVSSKWVAYSHELGAEVCWEFAQKASAG